MYVFCLKIQRDYEHFGPLRNDSQDLYNCGVISALAGIQDEDWLNHGICTREGIG